MKIKPRIKMGFKLLIIIIITILINSTISNKQTQKTEILTFNKTLGLNANASGEAITTEPIQEEQLSTVSTEKNKKESDNKTIKNRTITGNMTGYSADCSSCSGKLGCLPNYNVYKNNVVTYFDKTYGNIRIVASSKNLACGSIIKINSNKVPGNYAIVLDRGVSGNNLDLLVESENIARNNIGRSRVTYEVIRRGW